MFITLESVRHSIEELKSISFKSCYIYKLFR